MNLTLSLFLFPCLLLFSTLFVEQSSSIHIGWEDIPVGDPRLRMAIEAVKGKIGGIGPDVQYTVISATALQPGPLKYQTKVLFAKDTGITCDLTIAVNMGGVYELVSAKCVL